MSTTATPDRLARRARLLAIATVVWNVIEAAVAIAAGSAAGSIALVGFGLDSTVEVLSALVILWQFHGVAEARERRALRLIAVSFFALAAYVVVQALWDLTRGTEPDSSPVGIGLAIASLIVMPILAGAKQRTGRAMASSTVIADSNQSQAVRLPVGHTARRPAPQRHSWMVVGRSARRCRHRGSRRQRRTRSVAGRNVQRLLNGATAQRRIVGI